MSAKPKQFPLKFNNVFYLTVSIVFELPRWPSGPKRDCYVRGLGFDSQVEQKVLLGFSMKFSVAARS